MLFLLVVREAWKQTNGPNDGNASRPKTNPVRAIVVVESTKHPSRTPSRVQILYVVLFLPTHAAASLYRYQSSTVAVAVQAIANSIALAAAAVVVRARMRWWLLSFIKIRITANHRKLRFGATMDESVCVWVVCSLYRIVSLCFLGGVAASVPHCQQGHNDCRK